MFAFMYMWWFWAAMMLVFLLPVGYGWGYRGWGVPYPSYVQRRRMESAPKAGTSGAIDHTAWGLGGDVIWGIMLVDAIFFSVLLWRR
jgi:hypothetical protein